MKSKATGCGSISTVFSSIVLQCDNSIIVIIIRQCIIKHGSNGNNNFSIQHINLYKLSVATASIIKHTSKLLIKLFARIILKLKSLRKYFYLTDILTNSLINAFRNLYVPFCKIKIVKNSNPLKNFF